MKLINIYKIIGVVAFSFIISYFLYQDIDPNIIAIFPTIFGLILTGILPTLAIIFGFLNINEMKIIEAELIKKDPNVRLQDYYENVKDDTILIFSNFILSLIILIIINSHFLNSLFPIWILFAIILFCLILSLSATYDIINSLFTLNKLKFEIISRLQGKDK